jgi:dihydroxy-acid dehydratase
MLYATGLSEEDLGKPLIGIAGVYLEGNPCNMHINDLAAEVKAGTDAAGLVGMRFNTIGVSDGISMGTEGMSYSLQSRDLIADSMETVMRRPVVRRADRAARLRQEHAGLHHGHGAAEPPGIMVYGGTIRAGHGKSGAPLDIVSAFQSYGQFIAGQYRRGRARGHRPPRLPGPRCLRRHVHGQHHGLGHRGAGHVACPTARLAGHRPGKLDECRRAGAGDAQSAGAQTSSPPTS